MERQLTMVVMKRGAGRRCGFIVDANTVEEFSRKVSGLAGAVTDGTWKAYPLPPGTDPAKASRKTL